MEYKLSSNEHFTISKNGTDTNVDEQLSKCTEITYADLVTLRNKSGLVAGMWYRITDYVTITTQENTQSAGHQFDIIVRADDVNVLNENAYAAKHAGDTYFANSKLEAWKLLYCLDNINQADTLAEMSVKGVTATLNGTEEQKGITYYKLQLAENVSTGIYPGHNTSVVYTQTLNNGATVYAWLGSMVSFSTLRIQSGGDGKGVIYRMIDEFNNDCPYDFKNIQFRIGANANTGTVDNVFYYTFSVATGTNDATVTDHSLNGAYCYGNKMGVYINSNKQQLNSNVFRNTLATNNCYSNTFGDSCSGNTFGDSCSGNTFGNSCQNNTFGNGCSSNTFGNYCQLNTFGTGCHSNTFGNSCSNIKFGTSSTVKDYYQYIIVENGNQHIYLNCSATTSSSSYFQNVKIAQGVNNTSSYKTITHTTAGDTFQTVYKPTGSVEINV